MALDMVPVGTYANVTGVVNTTAKAEIVVLGAAFSTFLSQKGDAVGTAPRAPNFGDIPPATRALLQAEFDAVLAAIAASPSA
jgi:hypothetical protein